MLPVQVVTALAARALLLAPLGCEAARAQVPVDSPLDDARAVPGPEVLSLGGLADLRQPRARIGRMCERKWPQRILLLVQRALGI